MLTRKMRAYGLPRRAYIDWMDCVDEREYGIKGVKAKSKNRRSTRRYWKRVERQKAKSYIRNWEVEYYDLAC